MKGKERNRIKPAEGAQVLNPRTHEPLKSEGEKVIWGSYWERRLAEKSIELVSGPLKDRLDAKNKKLEDMKNKEAAQADSKTEAAAKAAAKAKAEREAEEQAERDLKEADAQAKADAETKNKKTGSKRKGAATASEEG